MSNVEEKLAKSLTANSTELIPFLPYLLQDLWELGSSPRDVIDLLTSHARINREAKVLDLACGKGAVSVMIAKELGCSVKGIDIISEFIDYAAQKADDYGVTELCQFEAGDINEAVKHENGNDVVILGAVGDVLGDVRETVLKLKGTVKPGGFICIDDAYGKNDTDDRYLTREKWLEILSEAEVNLVEEKIICESEIESMNEEQQALIVKRANELIEKYPEKSSLFEGYIKSQQEECYELENEISGVTLLLQSKVKKA